MPPKCQIIVRKTVLVVVEGDTEFAFCRYLKTQGARGRNIEIHIKNAHGGSPDKIVEYAQRLAKQSAYDQVVIIFDQDRPLTAEGEKIIADLGAMVFRFAPCIEGFFLKLIGRAAANNTDVCKHAFHQHGLDEKAKCEYDSYGKLFPIANFSQLSNDPQFDALRKLFTNS